MAEITITKSNFQKEVMESNVPVLIDFWATWCGPCRMLAPTIEEIAEDMQGKVKVGKVNIDDQPDLATSFNVMSIPTLVVIKNGKVINTSVGVQSKESILGMIK